MSAADFAAGGILERVILTDANAVGSNTLNDSSATYNGDGVPVIAHTTGIAGHVDHSLDIGLLPADYGDLPASYNTSLTANGPSHTLDGETFLGTGVDYELNGQESETATGDGLDENGVTFNTPLIAGQNATITVNASKDGYLNAWIDFDSSGTFDAGEQIATDLMLSAGDNVLTIAVPETATGTMAARFRFTCDDPNGALDSTGHWDNGEVEDYMLGAIGDKVWLDNGADGGIGGDGQMNGGEIGVSGVVVNLLNADGSPVLDASGVAVTTTTDDDGCYHFPGLAPGDYRVEFELPDGYQFTSNDSGDDASDSDANTSTGISPVYSISAGENNDTVDAGLQLQDFGDLPNGFGTDESDPAFAVHGIDGQTYLGAGVDAETDGQSSDDATGDGADEDGVVFNTPLIPGAPAQVTVTASKDGYLNAWIDFNSNGSFDAGEQIATDLEINAGANEIDFVVPADATGTMAARFRFTCDDPNGALDSTGPWGNGEVEDYVLGAIGNRVWMDNGDGGGIGGDGIQNGSEPGVEGVRVYLLDGGGDRITDDDGNEIFTTTDAEGYYEFPGLPADSYAVEFELPANHDFTLPNVGDEDSDSDADPTTGVTAAVVIGANNVNNDLDAGLVQYDFGDLPDDYGTTRANDGAVHLLDTSTFLGSSIDVEADGQPSDSATGDGADEDGVVFNTPLIPGQNASITVTASKDGYLNAWIDFNSNGAFEAGEQIAADLMLTAGANELTFAVPADATGTMAARFRFTCDDPDGALGSTGEWDNGEVEDYVLGAIGDKVWLDNGAGADGVGGDGIRNGDEPVVADVTVNLLNADGTPVLDADGNAITTTTDEEGCYEFPGLPAGDYRVEFVLPDGYQFTEQNVGDDATDSDPSPTDGITDIIMIGANTDDPTVDAGLQLQDFGDLPDTYGTTEAGNGAVHGLVEGVHLGASVDNENDGQPSEDASGDADDEDGVVFTSAFVAGTTATAEVTASEAGYINAWIDFNEDGNFDPEEQIASDFAVTAGANEISFSVPPDADMDNVVARFRFTSDDPDGELGPTGAWGNGEVEDYIEPLGSIGDFVWFDHDKDRFFDEDEYGYPGVTVTLTGDVDGDGMDESVTQVTDENGRYLFNGLQLMEWVVSVTLPSGTTHTWDAEGAVDDGMSTTTIDEDDVDDLDQDFGLTGTGAIGDTVFHDVNNDGVQDAGEIGIPGVPVALDVDLDGDGVVDFTLNTETGPNGEYLFDCVPAGSYTVTITPVYSMTETTDHDGDDTPDVSSDVTIGPGETNEEQDFGLIGPGSIGDTIFLDLDKDDELDAGESVADVTVYLSADLDGDGDLEHWSTVTDENGEYGFTGLPVTPDGIDYVVTIDTSTLPADHVWNTVDPDGGSPNTSSVTLTTGDPIDNNQDFGYVEVPHDLGISPKEQFMLEIINLARQNPAAAAAAFGIDLNDDLPGGTITEDAKQPLAPTSQLFEAAAQYAESLIDGDPFGPEDSGARVAAGIATLAELTGLTGSDLLSLGISAFGPVGAFNVFVFGDMTVTNTDSAGRVAVGGDATLTNFGVASGLLNPIAQPNSLMVGGTLVHDGGEVFEGNTVTGADVPLDFAELQEALEQLSDDLAALPDTHSTTVTSWNGIFMDATDSTGGLNVFTLNASDLANAVQFDIDADPGETVLVNVVGDTADISNFQMRVNGQNLQQGGEAPFELLFNFPTTTSMTSTGFSWQGHVLAPRADYQFDNGHINGQLIVNNLSGTGEFHDFYFDGVMPYTLGDYCPDHDVHSLLFLSAEHRQRLLSSDANEVGVAFDFGTYNRWEIDFDSAIGLEVIEETSDTYITGVVFNDSISEDGFYDIGEGIAHPQIVATGEDGTEYVAATAESGGYAILVPDGTYTITVTNGTDEWAAQDIVVDGENVKLDVNTSAGAYTSLSFSLEAPYVSERETMIGRVTRGGTDIDEPYEVTLSASSDLEVPATVTIPAGETSATFSITGVDDDALEGLETATINLNGPASIARSFDVPIREIQRLIPSDADGGDNTGHAIAIDGDIAVVGARFANVDGVRQSGVVYIYQRDAANKWVQITTIAAPGAGDADRGGGDRFGSALAVQGDTIVVGAPQDEAAGEAKNSGAVYVFKRNEGGADNWGMAQRIASSDSGLGDQFGSSVAIDGDAVVIGARIADGEKKKNTGAVYVFSDDGTEYVQEAILQDAESLRNDQFGYVVDIYGDFVIVGAPFTDGDSGADTGTAYIYKKTPDGTWELKKQIEAPDTEGDVSGGDRFAHAVGIHGGIAVVGAYGEEDGRADLSSGAAYIFRKGTGDGGWGQVARLRPDDIAIRDHFGYDVDISADRIVVGSRLKTSETGTVKAGAAYVFEREGTTDTWNQIDKLEAFDSKAKDYAGSAVAISGTYSAVGAQFSDTLGGNSGTAYIFHTNDSSPLLAAAPATERTGLFPLTRAQLQPIVDAAIDQWRHTPLTASQMAMLNSFNISIADLAGLRLGEANRAGITIDHDAAGHGWYVDPTPYDLTDDAIGNRMDLLTVVKHEIGHIIGLQDTYDSTRSDELMYGFLTEGERRSVFSDLDTLFSDLESM